MGSSPLTRGGLVYLVEVVGADGLIPAYAGRTILCSRPSRSYRAHPRLRGADYTTLDEVAHDVGSSPLTRGGLNREAIAEHMDRLIPAYAGRTLTPAGVISGGGAHPRLRGADRVSLVYESLREGSSPLTRGGLARLVNASARSGLIPAYAGRTRYSRCGFRAT